MKYADIAKQLYNNTEAIYLAESDAKKRSEQAIVFEELGVLLSLRDPALKADKADVLITFLGELGVDCSKMYVVSKEVTPIDTVYTIGYTHQPNQFSVIVEINSDGMQAGIIHHMDQKG